MNDQPEPFGLRLWLLTGVVIIVVACLQSYGIGTWPMADDEVPSLVELGLIDVSATTFSVPEHQVGRLARTNPVWYRTQRFLIDLLPKGEASYRVPSVVYGVLTAAIVFLVAARWRGVWFATALSIMLNGSLPFLFLAQLNRFYSMPMLLLTLTVIVICWPRPGRWPYVAAALLTVLTVLSHNITMAAIALTFLAAVPAYLIGAVDRRIVMRSGVAAAVGVALYFGYIRPIIEGWASTGNPTPILVSFAAHAGVPTLALAGLGVCVAFGRKEVTPAPLWWLIMFAGSLCVYQLARFNFNPRYFLFFLPPVWVLAADAMTFVAVRLGRPVIATAWYGVVALLLAPGVVSHLQDGSRHDYREAARVVLAARTAHEPILSDDAETISYYLPADARADLRVRTKVTTLPGSEFLLVTRANVWMPLPRVPGRQLTLLAEISRRRVDQFSHILRVYRVASHQIP